MLSDVKSLCHDGKSNRGVDVCVDFELNRDARKNVGTRKCFAIDQLSILEEDVLVVGHDIHHVQDLIDEVLFETWQRAEGVKWPNLDFQITHCVGAVYDDFVASWLCNHSSLIYLTYCNLFATVCSCAVCR